MKILIVIIIGLIQVANLSGIDYEELYGNGQVEELRDEIYSQPFFDESELPRAAFYESLVTSKNFDQTLEELIKGFPEMEFKDKVNFKLGIINFFQRKYSQAEFYYAKVENTDQFNEYNYWLARLYFMKQEHKQSSKYASMFIENCDLKDHKYELSFYMLIENSISQGNFQKGVVLAEELLMNKPQGINQAYLNYRMGYCYERIDNISLAVAKYKQSFELDPYSQYAAIIEERLYELKKNVNGNLDLAFLYTKNYPADTERTPKTYKTTPKSFNITEMVRTDTSTVLSKFFNNYQNDAVRDDLSKKEINKHQDILLANKQTDILQEDIPQTHNNNQATIPETPYNPDKIRENRAIDATANKVNDQNGEMPGRPTNIQTEDYVYLMNKPVGKYFIQIGRFTKKEFAVNRVKELFHLQRTWNIFRDVNDNNITYVIWSQPYDNVNQAKEDITFFKSQQVDCFLISNE